MTDSGVFYTLFCVLFAVATVSTSLRLYVRRVMTIRRWGLEDYIITGAWLILLSSLSILCVMIHNNGLQLENASTDQLNLDLRVFFVLPFTYTLDLWLIKFSLLAFYNRIFTQPQLKRYIFATSIILGLTLLACFLTQLLFCRPIADNFNPVVFESTWSTLAKPANIVFCVLTVTTDIMLMLIPLSTLPKLRLNLKKKLSLVFLFALGSFAIVASLIRTVLFLTNATLAEVVLWSFVEEVICILVANGPLLRPLFFRGGDFESSGSAHNRTALNHGGRGFHDIYEMSPTGKDVGFVSVVESVGNPGGKDGKQARQDRQTENTVAVLRTVEVTVQSREGKESRFEDDSSQASYEML